MVPIVPCDPIVKVRLRYVRRRSIQASGALFIKASDAMKIMGDASFTHLVLDGKDGPRLFYRNEKRKFKEALRRLDIPAKP